MKYLFYTLIILFAFPLCTCANSIHLKIVDETSSPLSYCDIFIKGKWNLVTNGSGCVEIQKSLCNVGDTLRVHYLGYEELPILISNEFLNNSEQTIQLEPKSYVLDDIAVNGTFNAANFFKDKKKEMLMPYTEKRNIALFAQISYVDSNGTPQQISDSIKVLFQMKAPKIIEYGIIKDSLLQERIKRTLQLASYIPYGVCFQKFRKLYHISYLGIRNHEWIFMFNVLPTSVTHPFFGFQKGDESSTQINMDKNGFISSIETHAIIKSGMSRSYNLHADYKSYKSWMIPVSVNVTLIEESMNIKLFIKE